MKHSTSIVLNKGYLTVTAKGVRNNFESIIDGTIKINEAAKAYGVKYVLADYRKLKYNVALAEAFNLVKVYEQQLPLFSEIVICGVVCKEDLELAKFWESICNRRGYEYKVFTDFNDAENWVKTKLVEAV